MRNKKLLALLLIMLLFFSSVASSQSLPLWSSGKTDFVIECYETTISEQQAAQLLQKVLQQQSGFKWQIIKKNTTGKAIVVKQQTESAGKSGYLIRITKNQILLQADSANLMPCVGHFLERFTHCYMYSDTAFSYPFTTSLSVPATYYETYQPPISLRLLYERSAFSTPFAQWHGLSNQPTGVVVSRGLGWGLWIHSFFTLVPLDLYFQKHPEYYSIANGQPQQLCLTNPDVIKIAIASLKKLIAQNPQYKYWSVAQMDNEHYCNCTDCKKVMQQESNTAAGPIIRFVNEVARQFPAYTISTLAYQYSRAAPRTQPAENVLVQVCNEESDRSKPLVKQTEKGSFANDLDDWLKISRNIMVWDYTINFQVVPAPFPNMAVLQPNLAYFTSKGVHGVFEQGWSSTGGGLQDYKAYLLAKLLYYPQANADSITTDFFKSYYGSGGDYLLLIIKKMNDEVQSSGISLSSYDGLAGYTNNYLSPTNRQWYNLQIAKAIKAANNNTAILQRIDAFAQAFRYVDIELNAASVGSADWAKETNTAYKQAFEIANKKLLNEYAVKTRQYGPPTINEANLSVENFKQLIEKKLDATTAVAVNLATGGKVIYNTKYIPVFAGPGENALIDGSLGTSNWSQTWQGWGNTNIDVSLQLPKLTTIQNLKMRFFQDTTNRLVVPLRLEIYMSKDGQQFNKMAEVLPPVKAAAPQIFEFSKIFPKPLEGRFVRVVAVWPGYETISNKQYGSYMFTDEIYVQ